MARRDSPERAQRRAMNQALKKMEKRQRKASVVDTAPVAPNPLMKPRDPHYEERALAGQALQGEVMLAGCPLFTTKVLGDQVVVVDAGRVRPAICDACGRVPDHVFATGECPRLIDPQTALAMLLPPEALHDEPDEEPAIIVP